MLLLHLDPLSAILNFILSGFSKFRSLEGPIAHQYAKFQDNKKCTIELLMILQIFRRFLGEGAKYWPRYLRRALTNFTNFGKKMRQSKITVSFWISRILLCFENGKSKASRVENRGQILHFWPQQKSGKVGRCLYFWVVMHTTSIHLMGGHRTIWVSESPVKINK